MSIDTICPANYKNIKKIILTLWKFVPASNQILIHGEGWSVARVQDIPLHHVCIVSGPPLLASQRQSGLIA